NGFHLPVDMAPEPPAVRRPERKSPSLRSRQGPGSKRVKGTDPKHLLSVRICRGECYSGSIWREHRHPASVEAEIELSFLRWQYFREDGPRRCSNHPQIGKDTDNGRNQECDD